MSFSRISARCSAVLSDVMTMHFETEHTLAGVLSNKASTAAMNSTEVGLRRLSGLHFSFLTRFSRPLLGLFAGVAPPNKCTIESRADARLSVSAILSWQDKII